MQILTAWVSILQVTNRRCAVLWLCLRFGIQGLIPRSSTGIRGRGRSIHRLVLSKSRTTLCRSNIQSPSLLSTLLHDGHISDLAQKLCELVLGGYSDIFRGI